MLDLGSAIILGLVVTGLVKLARDFAFGDTRTRITVGICLVVSVAAVLLVAASDFASEQVVLDRPLDSLNTASQLVVALLLAGFASVAWQTLGAVRNVGENEPKYGPPPAGSSYVHAPTDLPAPPQP